MRRLAFLVVALIATLIAWVTMGCPGVFERLPLRAEFDLYIVRMHIAPVRDSVSLTDISWHGIDAANAAAEYLTGKRRGLSKRDAIEIIDMVQERGCDLRGTEPYMVLKRVRASGRLASDEAMIADLAIVAIEKRHAARPGVFDGRTDGPCERGR